jgi:hypothetical protein
MPIPPPPPELLEWLLQILQGMCPQSPEGLFKRIKAFGLLDEARIKRGLAQKYRDEGRQDEWRQTSRDVMRQVREAARDATLDDVKGVFDDDLDP